MLGAWPRLSSLSPIWMVGALLAESVSFGCAFALQRLFLKTFLPLTPGGLGIIEAGLSSILILAGVSPSKAFLATLAYRLCSYWLPLMSGPVAYLLFRRRYGPKTGPRRTGTPPPGTSK